MIRARVWEWLRRRIPVLALASCVVGCMSGAQLKACNVEAAKVDEAYGKELIVRCYGYELELCPYFHEIENKYAAQYAAVEASCSKS